MLRALSLCALLCAVSIATRALPPPGSDPNSELGLWYKSLHTRDGGSCCGLADCRHFPVRIIDGHYQAEYFGQWLDVPDNAVIEGNDNPTGDYVTCVQGDYHYDGVLTPRVLCFKKAPRV